ncbi:DUF3630 family protein [Shewanella sp. JM162201]|uniref:DUF3630 family protein n=1 Tax=Shewanella jiangmenensis TaxID=2837387 RepID=A0ABS5V4I0_9GAMM|nr:DUF3630 family protein [Shewanella jiangmenensis]MBT1445374.1 DUF3630 family protein [Shewanella jiangmenensis]
MKLHQITLDRANLSLAIQGDIDVDHFEQFAEPLAAALDCRVLERQWGADRHQWLLDFEGCRLWLNFEFYGDVAWLASDREQDWEVLEFLAGLLRPLCRGAQS